MTCRRLILFLAIQTACASPALADEGTDQATVESCLACHRGALSLQEQTTETLLAKMTAIAQGSAMHPVDLPDLNDEELAAVAKALTTK